MRELKFRVSLGKGAVIYPSASKALDMLEQGYTTSVMQYIGLKDKNGKEIYEGDIVRGELGVFEVKWGRHSMGLDGCKYLKSLYGWHVAADEFLEYFQQIHYPENWEVIGNIHEHPDLLQ